MKWWLTVFFLIGTEYVPGDQIDGWASRAYATREECMERLRFAEYQTRKDPLKFKASWVCNEGRPAERPDPPSLNVDREFPRYVEKTPSPPGEINFPNWTGSTPLHRGLHLFTHANTGWIKEDAIGLRFTGPLTYPLAENLQELLLATPQVYNHVVLELDSPGGELSYVLQIVEVLAKIRGRASLVTRVMGAQVCASGCVAVFMQGQIRKASGASVWIFHGARRAESTEPLEKETEEYLNLLEKSGVSNDFTSLLRREGYVSRPGNYFLSGYELHKVHQTGIIMELLPAWQQEDTIIFRANTPR